MTDLLHRRREDIQGIRALAVLLVVAYHAELPLHGGFLGVDVFFVISGFVITASLLRPLETYGRLDLVDFYVRRVRRLLPALTIVVVLVSLLSVFLLSPFGPQQSTSRTGQAASLFAANFQLFRSPKGYFDLDTNTNALLHTWSLSVEEQFYFVFPTLLALGWKLGSRWGRRTYLSLGMVIAVVVLVSFTTSCAFSFGLGVRIAHTLGNSARALAFYLPVTRAWEFGIGCGAAVLLAHRSVPRVIARGFSVVGIGLTAFAAVHTTAFDPIPGLAALAPTVGTCLLIVGGSNGDNLVTRVLSTPIFRWVGDLSYSWYLWHWPMIVFARAAWPGNTWISVIAGVGALGPAWVSFTWVERPLRANPSIVGRRAVALLAGCVALSVGCAFALRSISAIEETSASAASLQLALRSHTDTDACPTTIHGARGRRFCLLGDPKAKGTIALIGDSQAQQLVEVVSAEATQLGYNTVVAMHPGCAFVDALVEIPGRDADGCRAFVREALDTVAQLRPVMTIVSTASTTYVKDNATAYNRWAEWTGSIVARLRSFGAPVLVVHMPLQIDGLALVTCPFVRILRDAASCATSFPRAGATLHRETLAAEQKAVANVPDAIVYDPTDDLCGPQTCEPLQNGVWVFRDEGHISIEGALQLGPRFAELIQKLLPAR